MKNIKHNRGFKSNEKNPKTLVELLQNTHQNFLSLNDCVRTDKKEEIKGRIRVGLGLKKVDLI